MEWTRNIFLIALAAAVIIIFFNLDFITKGESVFSNSAVKKLKFSGKMDRSYFTKDEQQRLLDYIKTRDKLVQEIKISASPQDSYKQIRPASPILFEVHVTLTDGAKFTTPVRRTERSRLIKSILAKINKDVQAYLQLKKEGRDTKVLINTM